MSVKNKIDNSFVNDLVFDTDLNFDNRAETDVLIREEAKHLAEKFLANQKLGNNTNNDFASMLDEFENKNVEELKKTNTYWAQSKDILSRIDSKLVEFDKEIKKLKGETPTNFDMPLNTSNDDLIGGIKKTLNENNESLKDAFQSMIFQLADLINGTQIKPSVTKEVKDEFIEELNSLGSFELEPINFDNNIDFEVKPIEFDQNPIETTVVAPIEEIEPIDWDNITYGDSQIEKHLPKKHELTELDALKEKQQDLLNSQEKINKEIEIIKQSINDYILNCEYSNKNILEQTIDNAQRLTLDVGAVKEKYSNLENEINKIYQTWVDNNQLLTNLETLILDLSTKNDNLVDEKYLYNEEIATKTANNEKCINQISIESENLKNSIEQINQRLELIENISKTFNPDDYVKDNLTQTMVNEVKTISKDVVEDALIQRSLLDPSEIMTRARVIDEVMESDIFNYSLEKKIIQTIADEKLDKRITDDDKLELLNFTINSDKFKNIISSEVNYLSNDVKLELNDRFNKLRDDFHNINCHNTNKFNEIENRLDSKEDFLQKHQIIEMVFSSKELEDIINDKLIYVVNNQLDELKESIKVIENKILNSVKRYLDEDVQDNLKKEIIDSKDIRQKIKNESLNAIYQEINERDKKFEEHKKEILENYEALFENNRILENLEKLLLKQVEEVEGFKRDKETSVELAIEKITAQKEDIDYLKEKVREIYGKDLVANTSADQVYENEIYDKVRNITTGLVRDEIKKLNLISASNTPSNSTTNISNNENLFLTVEQQKDTEVSDFFKNRIKDILGKLEENYEEVKLNETIPLANELKFNLEDLKIELEELKEEPKEQEELGYYYEDEVVEKSQTESINTSIIDAIKNDLKTDSNKEEKEEENKKEVDSFEEFILENVIGDKED